MIAIQTMAVISSCGIVKLYACSPALPSVIAYKLYQRGGQGQQREHDQPRIATAKRQYIRNCGASVIRLGGPLDPLTRAANSNASSLVILTSLVVTCFAAKRAMMKAVARTVRAT